MTRYRAAYALVLCAGFVFYIFFRGWLSFFTLIFLAALPLLSLALAWPAARRVTAVLRAVPPAAQKGESFRFVVTFTGNHPLPLTRAGCVLSVRNTLSEERARVKKHRCRLAVNGRSTQSAELGMSSAYCGKVLCTAEKLRCYDYLGLFAFSLGPAQTAQVFVTPRTLPIAPILTAAAIPSAEGGSYSSHKPGNDSSETFGVRAYRAGDPLRAIHWKLSCRTGDLMVREFSLPLAGAVELLVELSGSLAGRDALLDALVSLCRFFLDNNTPHRVSWYDAARGELILQEIACEDDLPPVLSALLSQAGKPGVAAGTRFPCVALACRAAMEDAAHGGSAPPCARFLYLTAAYGPEARSQLEKLEHATVLAVMEDADAATESLLPLVPGKLTESLTALTI